MRRLIAYIMMALTMLVCVGVAFTPVFTKMTAGREYSSGNEIVYELKSLEKDDQGDYLALPENDTTGINDVVNEMKSRLEDYGVEDYSVKVEGNSSIRVQVSVKDNNELTHIRKYLAFSGKDFSLTNSKDARVDQQDLFGDKEAYIVREQDVFPYLIIPVNNYEKVRTLVDDVSGGETNKQSLVNPLKAEGEEQSPNIYLWNNIDDNTPTYSEVSTDNVFLQKHLIRSFINTNFWYEKSSEEKTEIAILFGSKEEGSDNYDTSKLEEANNEAKYYQHLLNAPAYKYHVEDLFVTESSSGIVYNSITAKASLEELLTYGNVVNVALSLTLISTLVALVIVSLILVVFYRLNALGMIANTVSSVFLTFLLFAVMKSTFNIGTVVGGILIAITSLIVEIFYANKFKDEVYKGRSVKKANQEASKKMNLISIDVAVITAFIGLMIYFIAGNALKSMGVVLFFGSIINLLMNLISFKILTWLITNETAFQKNYKVFNIEESKVPSIVDSSEKKIYEGPYEEKDFTKHKKIFGLGALVLAVASLAGIITFGVINKSPLNVEGAQKDTTIAYVSIKADNPEIDSTETFKIKVLSEVTIRDQKVVALNEDGTYKVNLGATVDNELRVLYDSETTTTTKYNYYVVNLDATLNDAELRSLEEQLQNVTEKVETKSDQEIITSAKVTHETVTTPSQLFIMVATLVGVAGAAFYACFRFKPSRGVALFITTSLSSLITFGVLSLTRIPTSAITSLVIPVTAIISLTSAIYFLSKQKDGFAEVKTDASEEEKKGVMVKSIALSAGPLLISAIISGYITINYFGFGPIALSVLFGGMLLGVILSSVLNLTLLGVISSFFAKLFKKIKLPQIKRKPKREKIKLQAKKNSSEPEETIFIGIND